MPLTSRQHSLAPRVTRIVYVVLTFCTFLFIYKFLTRASATMPLGWHKRAVPVPDPTVFTPTRGDLALAVLHHAPANPAGFTLALFRPNIAVDASGRVLTLSPTDFDALSACGHATLRLPHTGSAMNAWRIARRTTSQPIVRMFVPQGLGLVETSVQGFAAGEHKLKTPVGEYDELPGELVELVGLVLEARDGYEKGREDTGVLEKVREILSDIA